MRKGIDKEGQYRKNIRGRRMEKQEEVETLDNVE
jgi:hypothetical protein